MVKYVKMHPQHLPVTPKPEEGGGEMRDPEILSGPKEAAALHPLPKPQPRSSYRVEHISHNTASSQHGARHEDRDGEGE